MDNAVVVTVTGLLAITIIVVAGVAMGHDGALLAGSIATVAGIVAGVGSYKASQAKYPTWHEKRVEKEKKDDGGNV